MKFLFIIFVTMVMSRHLRDSDGDDRRSSVRNLASQIRREFQIEFTHVNGSEIVAPMKSIFQVIPPDYLCDFCINVIGKLKERQKEDEHFQKKLEDECWKYNGTDKDDGHICELINRVNLERLSNDPADRICIDEKLCEDKEKLKEEIAKEEEAERIKEEKVERRKELERTKIETIESIKTEAARKEYEKRREEEKRKRAERRKVKNVHSRTGDIEYVIDEVDREQDENNDYLEEKTKHKVISKPAITATEPTTTIASSPPITIARKETTAIANSLDVPVGESSQMKISGDASVDFFPPRKLLPFLLDRSVSVQLNIEDIAK